MADFLQVIPDRFVNAAERVAMGSVGGGLTLQGKPFVRRPTRGIDLKEETFATLRVVSAKTGDNISIVDAGSRRTDSNSQPLEINGKRATDIYSNFLLQQVQEERMEKQQILETFGEAFIFLFGERPRIITFSGILANTFDFNWEAEWWHNYDNYLRGTRCVENDCRVFLSYDNTLVGGYILGTSSSKVAQERNYVTFQFQMFVTSYSNFSTVGNPYALPGFEPQLTGSPDGVLEVSLDAASTLQFRPKLLPNFGNIPISNFGSPVDGNGKVGMPTLEKGLLQALSVVNFAWTSTQNIVNSAVNAVSGLLNGDHVRVPVGFAGSMAFDEDNNVRIKTIQNEVPVRYSTFDKNDDEYVGVGDHYGSSSTNGNFVSKFLKNLGYTDISEELNYGQSLVTKATNTWGKPPFNVKISDTQLGPLSSFIVGKGVGLLLVGATRVASVAAGGINSIGSAAQTGDPAAVEGAVSSFASGIRNHPIKTFLE